MGKFKITNGELKKRAGYLLLGFFTFYLVSPIREIVNEQVQLNPILVGLGGILLTLYFFDFG